MPEYDLYRIMTKKSVNSYGVRPQKIKKLPVQQWVTTPKLWSPVAFSFLVMVHWWTAWLVLLNEKSFVAKQVDAEYIFISLPWTFQCTTKGISTEVDFSHVPALFCKILSHIGLVTKKGRMYHSPFTQQQIWVCRYSFLHPQGWHQICRVIAKPSEKNEFESAFSVFVWLEGIQLLV
jgi:hypothetical protein